MVNPERLPALITPNAVIKAPLRRFFESQEPKNYRFITSWGLAIAGSDQNHSDLYLGNKPLGIKQSLNVLIVALLAKSETGALDFVELRTQIKNHEMVVDNDALHKSLAQLANTFNGLGLRTDQPVFTNRVLRDEAGDPMVRFITLTREAIQITELEPDSTH